MWCPSVSLSVWANAWLAGHSAPDDVLDALSCWAPRQSVLAHDAVAAGSAGLPWPERSEPTAVSLLAMVRAAAGTTGVSPSGPIHPVLPVPGDVRGLPAGTEFAREALAVGEAVVLAEPATGTAVGLVPDLADGDPDTGLAAMLTWTVHALPEPPPAQHHDLGDAEYALRAAVRSAAEAMSTVSSLYSGPDDPRDLVEDLVDATRHHRIPDHAPVRAVRVLENATLVDAILTVGAQAATGAAQSSSQAQHATAALGPLASVVRSARTAAVEAILGSAWRG